VVRVNSDQIDKLGVVAHQSFSFRTVLTAVFASLGASFRASLRNSVERAPTAIGVVQSISELSADAKQLGNGSGLRGTVE